MLTNSAAQFLAQHLHGYSCRVVSRLAALRWCGPGQFVSLAGALFLPRPVATLRAINHVLRLWNSAFGAAIFGVRCSQIHRQRQLGSVPVTELFSWRAVNAAVDSRPARSPRAIIAADDCTAPGGYGKV